MEAHSEVASGLGFGGFRFGVLRYGFGDGGLWFTDLGFLELDWAFRVAGLLASSTG